MPNPPISVPARLRLRGRSFIAVALVPETPVAEWLERLDAEMERAPTFFVGRPVVLDLSVAGLREPGLRALLGALTDRNIRVLGIEGADDDLRAREIAGWPPILNGGRPSAALEIEPAPEPTPVEPAPAEPASLLVDRPVRSGQSVVFPAGDVTVIGSVGSGAEIMAGGSIHIYGALRGRAIAGIMGDSRARVFCQRLEAELIAIDGLYRTADDMDPALRGRHVQAWLERDTIVLAGMD